MPYIRVEERRDQIVAAARRALTRDGVAATTMRSMAAEAGVPLGTLHYAFQSKDELFKAVLADIIGELRDALQALAQQGAGLEPTLRAALQGGLSRVTVRPQTHLLQYELFTYALRTPGLDSLARWQYGQYCDIIARSCQQAAASAAETCAVGFDVIARVLVAALDGLILQYLADPDHDRASADLDHVISAVVALARPAAAANAG